MEVPEVAGFPLERVPCHAMLLHVSPFLSGTRDPRPTGQQVLLEGTGLGGGQGPQVPSLPRGRGQGSAEHPCC